MTTAAAVSARRPRPVGESLRRLFLVAHSEAADEFWDSMGWERHENPDEPGSRTIA
jgi:hypothetical protein